MDEHKVCKQCCDENGNFIYEPDAFDMYVEVEDEE
jgi:hypothetical protein